MHNETDATVTERDRTTTERRKKISFFNIPLLVATILILTMATVGMVIVSRTKREKGKQRAGVMAATYVAHASARELLGPAPVKASPKFNHVIFRLGDQEIFRFTYEDGGEEMRYSFEVREGGS